VEEEAQVRLTLFCIVNNGEEMFPDRRTKKTRLFNGNSNSPSGALSSTSLNPLQCVPPCKPLFPIHVIGTVIEIQSCGTWCATQPWTAVNSEHPRVKGTGQVDSLQTLYLVGIPEKMTSMETASVAAR
jgi:hypothetical protein